MLVVALEGVTKNETAGGFLYLMRRGVDPVALDRFTFARMLDCWHKVTAFAGHRGTSLLKLAALRDEDLSVTLRKLAIASAPPRGTIVVHSLRS